MIRTGFLPTLAGIVILAVPAIATGAASCHAESESRKAALVELYTSEGCSSCPPAERTLARLPAGNGPGPAIHPLALHVDYWDYIGWKDPYAQEEFARRHSQLVEANGHRTVYTPHFFVNGREIRGDAGTLSAELARVQGETARASVELIATALPDGSLRLVADARGPAPDGLVVHVALAQNELASDVTRGENRGSHLAHEHVVRSWLGPFAMAGGRLHVDRVVPAPAASRWMRGELVGFIEESGTGRVLQSVSLKPCTGADGG